MKRRPILNFVIRSVVQRRRFQIYCIGAPKTGTVSIANIFSSKFRTKHEPRYLEFARLIEWRMTGHVSKSDLRKFFRERDWSLWLECESSHPLAWFCDILVKEFPSAKFILPIRDCYSWLDSIINQHLNYTWQEESMRLRDIFFDNGSKHEVIEFDRLGLYTLDGYLHYWAKHNNFVLDSTPPNRLLVLPTHHISKGIGQLANFAGVAAEVLDCKASHSHKAEKKHHVLDGVDRRLIVGKIESICGPVIERFNKNFDLCGYELAGISK